MKRRTLSNPIDPQPMEQPKGNGHLNGHGFAPDHEEEEWVQAKVPGKKGPQGKYRPYMPDVVYAMRLAGVSHRGIGNALGIDEFTLRCWIGEELSRPNAVILEIREAYMSGGELADAKVAKSMFHRAVGYSHNDEKIFLTKDGDVLRVPTIKHYPPETTAGQFWLTNRQRHTWRNRMSQEMLDSEGQAITPPQLVVMPVSPQPNGKDK